MLYILEMQRLMQLHQRLVEIVIAMIWRYLIRCSMTETKKIL